jgi:hypothetical protein
LKRKRGKPKLGRENRGERMHLQEKKWKKRNTVRAKKKRKLGKDKQGKVFP